MKFMVALPTDQVNLGEEFVSGRAVAEMAALLERTGITGVFVTDHPAPDDRWLANGGHHALEPTVALSFAAAATTSLRIITNIYVLAYRNPLLAAKTLASLDVLSGGRLTLGVAAGYLRPEFSALGADFDGRNDRLDEAIDTMRSAWTGESFAGEGSGWSAKGVTMLPRPAQRPNLPIWCGGNSGRAMRRAVELGDGWMPFGTPSGLGRAVRTAEIGSAADLGRRLAKLDLLCEQHGRTGRPTICFSPISTVEDGSRFDEEIAELGALGVDWVSVTMPCGSRAQWSEAVASIGERFSLPRP